jgi:hypothetical protein
VWTRTNRGRLPANAGIHIQQSAVRRDRVARPCRGHVTHKLRLNLLKFPAYQAATRVVRVRSVIVTLIFICDGWFVW